MFPRTIGIRECEEMKFYRIRVVRLLCSVCLVLCSGYSDIRHQEAQSEAKKKLIVATTPQEIIGKLAANDNSTLQIRSSVAFRITSFNVDDTVSGTLTLKFSDAARKEITDKTSDEFTEVVELEDITAFYQTGTLCPDVKLELPPLRVSNLEFGRNDLTINELPTEISDVFCRYLRCRERRGLECRYLRHLNQLLSGEEDQ